LAIERGEAGHNPCRGGQFKRNKERPRTEAPEAANIAALVAYAAQRGSVRVTAKGKVIDTTKQWRIGIPTVGIPWEFHCTRIQR
jgi:hypothetical protein